jgi:large subunit ribosomal protein L10
MPKPEKIEAVKNLKEMLKDAKGVYLADFTGLTVPEITELRKRLKEKGYIFKVIKNTLARTAFEELGKTQINQFLVGPNALLVSHDDVVEPVKIFFEFKKEFQKSELKVGFIEDRILEAKELEALSKLPGLSELRAKIVGALQSPLYGLVYHLKGLLSSLVLTLESLKKKKEEEIQNG